LAPAPFIEVLIAVFFAAAAFSGATSSAAAGFELGQNRNTPDFSVFSSRYGLLHLGHFFATSL